MDTGFPEKFITDPPISDDVKIDVHQENFLVYRLAEIGLKPTGIDLVLVSHLDYDHAGNLLQFPHAEIVLQRLQYETDKAGHTRFYLPKINGITIQLSSD